MVACFTAPNQLEPKRQQPTRQDDAMVFWPWPGVVAEIALDVPQPVKGRSLARGF